MRSFEFFTADSADHASQLLSMDNKKAYILAGGTDLLGEIKEETVTPERLVSLQNLNKMKGIAIDGDALRVGALTTLSEVATNSEITNSYPALSQAALSVANTQIRNVGTIGGNICQRPRCWYYRSNLFHCLKKGGDTCFALAGNNKFHAIIGGVDCHIVHPSDTAVALMSLKAQVTLSSSKGSRVLAMDDFFHGPEQDVLSENVLQAGEIVSSIVLPGVSANHRSVYLKAKERQAMDFALSSVALALSIEDNTVGDVRVTLGGVSPFPYRARHIEEALEGQTVGNINPEKLGRMAVQNATPMKDNSYKVKLTTTYVSRAIQAVLN